MRILLINGSSRPDKNNAALLHGIVKRYEHYECIIYHDLSGFPLYLADLEDKQVNQIVKDFKIVTNKSDVVIVSTPEYIYGVPAILKNALEWLTQSGELNHKKILAITYTPHQPRGAKCMEALLQSLKALNSDICASLQLYQDQLTIDHNHLMHGDESLSLLDTAVDLLTHIDVEQDD